MGKIVDYINEIVAWVVAHAKGLVDSAVGFVKGAIADPVKFILPALVLIVLYEVFMFKSSATFSYVKGEGLSVVKELAVVIKDGGLVLLGAIFLYLYNKHNAK